MAKEMTFQTALDKDRETVKAYKVIGGAYLPKSQVRFELLWEEDSAPFYGAKKLMTVQHGMVTMPEWLARR